MLMSKGAAAPEMKTKMNTGSFHTVMGMGALTTVDGLGPVAVEVNARSSGHE